VSDLSKTYLKIIFPNQRQLTSILVVIVCGEMCTVVICLSESLYVYTVSQKIKRWTFLGHSVYT